MRRKARNFNCSVMKILFPGSFDPFTSGHADLVERALKIADSLVVAIGVNPAKKTLWTPSERLEAISRYYAADPRVSVMTYEGLTFNLMKKVGADVMLRGVRSAADFEAERSLADANRIVGGVETLLMVSDPAYQHVSSSLVRELIGLGHPVDGMMLDTFIIPESK